MITWDEFSRRTSSTYWWQPTTIGRKILSTHTALTVCTCVCEGSRLPSVGPQLFRSVQQSKGQVHLATRWNDLNEHHHRIALCHHHITMENCNHFTTGCRLVAAKPGRPSGLSWRLTVRTHYNWVTSRTYADQRDGSKLRRWQRRLTPAPGDDVMSAECAVQQ